MLSFRLPDLVLALIFSFLLETERICTVMLVCRKWYDVIHGSSLEEDWHYACLNRLNALGTFVSAEDLWSHNLWKAHSLGAELHRGSVSRAVEVIFESKSHYSANFSTKTTPDFNTV